MGGRIFYERSRGVSFESVLKSELRNDMKHKQISSSGLCILLELELAAAVLYFGNGNNSSIFFSNKPI